MKKLPISAIVVSKDEGHLLSECLASIQFCDEILVVDLKSSDNTVAIAEKYSTRVITIPPLPLVELVHREYIPQLKNDWVLLTDPDEVCSQKLQYDILNNFDVISRGELYGGVRVPIKFYFKRHPLEGTIWGGANTRLYLIDRRRFLLSGDVHQGKQIIAGYEYFTISEKEVNVIHHYWMTSFRQLFEKHVRYLKSEGKVRFNAGQRTSMISLLRTPLNSFWTSFITCKGYKDGHIGFLLSIFWSWYQTTATANLLRYGRKKAQDY